MDRQRRQPQRRQRDRDAESVGHDGTTSPVNSSQHIAIAIFTGVVDGSHKVDCIVNANTDNDARDHGSQQIQLDITFLQIFLLVNI